MGMGPFGANGPRRTGSAETAAPNWPRRRVLDPTSIVTGFLVLGGGRQRLPEMTDTLKTATVKQRSTLDSRDWWRFEADGTRFKVTSSPSAYQYFTMRISMIHYSDH